MWHPQSALPSSHTTVLSVVARCEPDTHLSEVFRYHLWFPEGRRSTDKCTKPNRLHWFSERALMVHNGWSVKTFWPFLGCVHLDAKPINGCGGNFLSYCHICHLPQLLMALMTTVLWPPDTGSICSSVWWITPFKYTVRQYEIWPIHDTNTLI